MKTILVPIGTEKRGINTLQYAIHLAEEIGASIYVVKVFGAVLRSESLKKFDDILEADAKKILASVLNEVDKKDVSIKAKTVKGDIKDTIERLARQLDIDLIVASSKARKNNHIFLGKIAGGLVKETNVPVLFVPVNCTFRPVRNILMAIKSGQIASEKVLDPVLTIKNTFKSTLNLLQVFTPDVKEDDKVLHNVLDQEKDSLTTSENATIYQGILEYLHETDPDMICVIRRKRGFFARLWQGDRVHKKDFESRVPLLVLKVAK